LKPDQQAADRLSFARTRRQTVLALRFVIFAVLVLLSLYQLGDTRIAAIPFIIAGIYGVSNILLLLRRKEQIEGQRNLIGIFLLDTIIVSLFVLSLGVKLVEFYTVYFLTVLLAATSRRLAYALVAAFVAALFYTMLAYFGRDSAGFLSSAFAVRIVLFFVTALFVGYLAEDTEKHSLARRALDRFAKQKELEARKSSESLDRLMRLYEAVTESIPSAVLLCDSKMNLLFYNEKMGEYMETLSDLKTKEGESSRPYELIDRLKLREDFQEVVDTRNAVGPKRLVRHTANGSARYFRYRVYPITDSSDNLVFVMCVLDDFTETELANEKLQASEVRFRGLFENAANGILIFELDAGRILEANPSAKEMLRVPRSKLISAAIWDFVPPAKSAQIRENLAENTLSEKGIFWELKLPDNDAEVTLEFHVHPIEYASKKAAQALIIDTTTKKRMEAELERSKAAEKAAQKEIEIERKMIKELERINSLKTSFMSVVTHELKTPMTSIRSALELIMGQPGKKQDSATRKYFDIALRNIDRLAALVNDVLDISRIESGRLKLNRKTADLCPIVTDAIATCQGNARKREIQLEFDTPEKEVRAHFDRNSIMQVLVNLIGNGVKYSPNGSKVWVTLETSRSEVQVSVHDNGEGIPTEELNKIFDAFYMVAKTQSSAIKGTGLGLAICRGIVKAHGGRIWVESQVGKGASFIFTLPVEKESTSADQTPGAHE
jgi:PAS domain S-box-containing protein